MSKKNEIYCEISVFGVLLMCETRVWRAAWSGCVDGGEGEGTGGETQAGRLCSEGVEITYYKTNRLLSCLILIASTHRITSHSQIHGKKI